MDRTDCESAGLTYASLEPRNRIVLLKLFAYSTLIKEAEK